MKKLFLYVLLSVYIFAFSPEILQKMDMTQLAKIIESSTDPAPEFGAALAIDGNTVVIGTAYGQHNTGVAYVYEQNCTDGLFKKVAKLTPSDQSAYHYFGISVAIDGDTIVVGANEGNKAYVFKKPNTGWHDSNETAILVPSEGVSHSYFGGSVAINGDTIVVGAWSQGIVYLFKKPGSGWISTHETAKLTASDGVDDDQFGVSVAIDTDTVVIGAAGQDEIAVNAGALYVFEKIGSDWQDSNETAKLTLPSGASGDRLGYNVAISNDRIVAGLPGHDGVGSDSGAAYVFQRNGNWNSPLITELVASDNVAWDNFGRAVDIYKNRVVVSAEQHSTEITWAGVAYVFTLPEGDWLANISEDYTLTALDAQQGDQFGHAVSMSNDKIAIGANYDDDNGDKTGSVYVFGNVLTVNTIENKKNVIDIDASDDENNEMSFTLCEGQDSALFTIDQATGLLSFKQAPDFEIPKDPNGENIYRIIVKVSVSTGENVTNQVLVRVSNIEDKGKTPKAESFKDFQMIQASTLELDALMGSMIRKSGDTIVVSAVGYNNLAGAVYVFEYDQECKQYIQKSRLMTSDTLHDNDYFGSSIVISNDTIVVGAPYINHNDNLQSTGDVYLYKKPATGWTPTQFEDRKLISSDKLLGFGLSLAMKDDIIAIGSAGISGTGKGIIVLFKNTDNGWIEKAKLQASDMENNTRFSYDSIAMAGNTIAVGAGYKDVGSLRQDSGMIYIFEKPALGWKNATENAKIYPSDGIRFDLFGENVEMYGDTIIGKTSSEYNHALYIFEKPIKGWGMSSLPIYETAKLTPSDPSYNMFWGDISISSDLVAVTGSNKVYLYGKASNGWENATETRQLTSSVPGANDLGVSVVISEDYIMVGAPGQDTDGVSDSGACYIFQGKTSTGFLPAVLYLLN